MASEGVLGELRLIHAMLRDDLAACRRLAAQVKAGADVPQVRVEITNLQSASPLWQLRINCLRHCFYVHGHHNAEDAHVFPAVRAADPERMNPVVDKLEADHRRVSALLDEVESSAQQLVQDDQSSRGRLADALTDLSNHLLEHLDYEERALAPVLSTWNTWPNF
ncbi:MAG: hemerythrin domain-containing protein [Candidatus Nanopelagicales bacterium]